MGSFIHEPFQELSFPSQQQFGSTCFPQEFAVPLVLTNAGSGRKRPQDIPRVAAIWCLSPPPAVPPTHKFTHSWSQASSMLWELKPNSRLITAPRGSAAVCEREPKAVCSKPMRSAHRAVPSLLQRPFCEQLCFLRVKKAQCMESIFSTKSSSLIIALQGFYIP